MSATYLDERCILSLQAVISILSPATQRQKMQTHPSRAFTPPIKFTAGTLNFIGNVNPLVKVHTHTHNGLIRGVE